MYRLFYRMLVVLISVAFLYGCKGEDGEEGEVFFTLDWSSNVTAADFDNVTKSDHSTYSKNTRYELKPGAEDYVYWESNGTWYQLFVEIDEAESGKEGSTTYLPVLQPAEDGDDGKDRIYEIYLSGNTMYIVDNYLESNSMLTEHQESINNPGFQKENLTAIAGKPVFETE